MQISPRWVTQPLTVFVIAVLQTYRFRLSTSGPWSAKVRGMLTPGDIAPAVDLHDQDDLTFDWTALRGHRTLLFFYPKASTPGCTQQACGLRDIVGQVGDVAIVGVSPDKPAAQKKFADKYELPYPLLADIDHALADAYGVWKEKKNYGRTYMGIERSAFLIGPDGVLEQAWYKISPKDTPLKLLAALAS